MELKICYCAESDYLEDTICSKTEMSEKVSYDPKYDNAMYFVRDVLFKNSPKGQDYIDDYYKLSYVCKSHNMFVNFEADFMKIMSFIQKNLLIISLKDHQQFC
jgi:hypothetical protein